MKRLWMLAITFVVACGGPPKTEHSIVPEGSATPETCCCKSNPMTSDDGKPVYEMSNPMECSTKQGDCVAEVQCAPQKSE